MAPTTQPVPEKYKASYAAVQAFLDKPALSQKAISRYYVTVIMDGPLKKDSNGFISCLYYTYILFHDFTCLRLDMSKPDGPADEDTPGVLIITEPPKESYEYYLGQHANRKALCHMEHEFTDGSFTLKDYFEFLKSQKLLRFAFSHVEDTHPCHWHWYVISRMVLVGRLPSATSMDLLGKIERWNKRQREKHTGQGIPDSQILKIAPDVTKRPGIFDD